MPEDGTKSSILTPTQREYLRGEREDTTAANERMLRTRISKRMRQGIRDLQLIVGAAKEDRIDVPEALTEGEQQLPVRALAAVLFLWTEDNKMLSREVLGSPNSEESAQSVMGRRTEMFDAQVESGLRYLFEQAPPDRAVSDISNTLEVTFGPELSELAEADIAALPRRHIDHLFRAGELDHEEYAEVMQERFRRMDEGEIERRRPVGMVDEEEASNYGTLETFLDHKVREIEQGEEDTDAGGE